MFEISPENVCFVAIKARAFETQAQAGEEESASNAADDGFRSVLASRVDDPMFSEVKLFIEDLSDDEQTELVALTWIGRGDFTAEELPQAKAEAADRHTGETADYLLGIPLLSDYLEDALSEFGHSCADYEV